MEVKVGQWVRTDLGNIIQPSKIEIDKSIWECNDRLFYDTLTCTIIKIANTPQELIEVGDLVSCSGYYVLPRVIDEGDCEQLLSKYWQPFITKILTPNSNGSVYTQQWEADNE
jgi:hypothetical protein